MPHDQFSTPTTLVPQVSASGGGAEASSEVFQRLLKERIIFVGSAIDQVVANLVCGQLLLLEAEDA